MKLFTLAFQWIRIIALATFLLCLFGTAQAAPEDATDAAFAALLALPGGQPRDGAWIIPEQEEPVPKNEKALIARLVQLKKDGANFNAIRHRGTLLAHAIRAGKDRTSVWLLRNGADPQHVLFSKDLTAYDLALQFKRNAIVKLLENQYGFRPKASLTPSKSAASGKTAAASSTVTVAPRSRLEQAAKIMEKLLVTPYPDEAAQLEWQKFAATLSQAEYVAFFKNEAHFEALILLVRNSEGGLENALSRLPLELVRSKAQEIADLVAEASYVSYYEHPKISYNVAARSWPALWHRIDRALQYTSKPDLAGHIPPALWPELFASGYAIRDAAVTGCLLSAVDPEAFKALWIDFQRFFVDARETAPGLVLGKYRLAREPSPCYYSSSPVDTVAKLEFLRQQGVSSPVTGLRKSLLDEVDDLSLRAIVAAFSPTMEPGVPRLVQSAQVCDLKFNDLWLDALAKENDVVSHIPAKYAQVIELPGHAKCGLIVSGDQYKDSREDADDFFGGAYREGSTRCGDLPDAGEIWLEEDAQIRISAIKEGQCYGGCNLRKVRDTQAGKDYWLNNGERGPQCSLSWQLPDAFEWQTKPKDASLIPTTEANLVDRLLREQCRELPDSHDMVCRGIGRFREGEIESSADGDEVFTDLRNGRVVPIQRLVDQIGHERKAEYAAAIAAHHHAEVRRLLATGIPTAWTAAEILAVGKADLTIEEKRRRIAILFANADQLYRTLNNNRYDLTESLLAWMPYQDWKPILQIIAREPDIWRSAASSLRKAAQEANRVDLACAIDHAQGLLCGGGLVFD